MGGSIPPTHIPTTTKKMNLKEYDVQVKEWIEIYGQPEFRRNPTQVKLRICAKNGCGKVSNLHRHHTGSDFLFARVLPDKFAKRYIEFNHADWIYLCNQCHENIHRSYEKLTAQFNFELHLASEKEVYELCLKYQKAFRNKCERYIMKKKRITNGRRHARKHSSK